MSENPASPAKITNLHVKNRNFVIEIPDGRRTKRVISPIKWWRKLSPLERAHLKGELNGGYPQHSGQDRFEAGKRYSEIFDLSESSGRDSTDMDKINKSGSGAGISQAQSDAMVKRISVESHLPARDRQIIRMVCGEARNPPEAIRHVCGPD